MAPLPPGTQSAGGMPDRVKCLHALVAHELAVPGREPARAGRPLDAAGEWWAAGRCVAVTAAGTRVAAIDCGTNSLRLLIADVDPAAGRLTDVDRRMEIVRLGQGVDATGRLAPEALDRTLRALAGYAGDHRGRRPTRSGWSPPAPPGTRPTPPSSSAG